mmetsp:Transcript_31693/g.72549  ORF Transcript_31693/g.72549 Transcript_31693/m.72549 type:complete len:261 (-) Transcript_31693:141-923(-)
MSGDVREPDAEFEEAEEEAEASNDFESVESDEEADHLEYFSMDILNRLPPEQGLQLVHALRKQEDKLAALTEENQALLEQCRKQAVQQPKQPGRVFDDTVYEELVKPAETELLDLLKGTIAPTAQVVNSLVALCIQFLQWYSAPMLSLEAAAGIAKIPDPLVRCALKEMDDQLQGLNVNFDGVDCSEHIPHVLSLMQGASSYREVWLGAIALVFATRVSTRCKEAAKAAGAQVVVADLTRTFDDPDLEFWSGQLSQGLCR